jgi:hypothetical protein
VNAAKHTPGPWLLEMPPEGEWSSRWAYVRADQWGVVASIHLDNSLPHWDGPQRANARLIATAPELLAELCECREALSRLLRIDPDLMARVCGSTTLGNRLVHTRAVIAKATGSAS